MTLWAFEILIIIIILFLNFIYKILAEIKEILKNLLMQQQINQLHEYHNLQNVPTSNIKKEQIKSIMDESYKELTILAGDGTFIGMRPQDHPDLLAIRAGKHPGLIIKEDQN